MDFDAIWDDTKAELADAYRGLVDLAIAAVEAVIVIAVAGLVARRLKRRSRRALARTALHANVAVLISNAVSIGVYVLAATMVLGLFGASWTALLAVLSVSTLAVGLAFQDVLRSFVAGVYLLLERPFTIGDRVKIRDIEGEVESIDIRTTMLRTDQDTRVLVPNATVFSEIITNRSFYRSSHAALTIQRLPTDQPDLAARVEEAVAAIDGLRRPPRVRLAGVTDEGATVRVELTGPTETPVGQEALRRLRERFPTALFTIEGV